jgi:hypothetical protein
MIYLGGDSGRHGLARVPVTLKPVGPLAYGTETLLVAISRLHGTALVAWIVA